MSECNHWLCYLGSSPTYSDTNRFCANIQSQYFHSSPHEKMSTAIILSQGTEITTGRTLDSNAHWICQQLWNLGYSVEYILILPDEKSKIVNAFRQSIKDASLVISTGGLGPTNDDYTAECLAEAFDLELAVE